MVSGTTVTVIAAVAIWVITAAAWWRAPLLLAQHRQRRRPGEMLVIFYGEPKSGRSWSSENIPADLEPR